MPACDKGQWRASEEEDEVCFLLFFALLASLAVPSGLPHCVGVHIDTAV